MRAIASRRCQAIENSRTTFSTNTSRDATCRSTQRLFARVGLLLRKRNAGGAWAGVLDQNVGGARGGRRGGAAVAQLPAGGVRIPSLVNWGTPAFNAGLEGGDVIAAADGRAIANLEDWQAAVHAHKPGDRMTVEFKRHGVSKTTTIAIAEDPTMEVVTLESTGAILLSGGSESDAGWLAGVEAAVVQDIGHARRSIYQTLETGGTGGTGGTNALV